MAKQAGPVFIEGTLDDLSFYKMYGKYYVRMKSSLTGKKFWKHEAFERSRQSCSRFGEGNRLASKLYRRIEDEKRQYQLFCFLKKKAILLFKEGKSEKEAEATLLSYLEDFGFIEKTESRTGIPSSPRQDINTNVPAKTFEVVHPCGGGIRTAFPRPRLNAFRPVLWDRQTSLEFEFPPDPLWFRWPPRSG